MPLLLERAGALHSARRARGWGSFPEMWQLGKRQLVWWLWDAVTFALGALARRSEAASLEPPRDKQAAKEEEG